MIVIPTIDLRHGASVQPNPANGTDEAVSPGNPIALARSWAHAGFQRIHVVDTDADTGAGSNARLLEDIIRDGALEVLAGGGVQSTDHIERLADAGAARVVVGSRGIAEPHWLASVAEAFPGLIVVSTDVRERRVVTRGWVRNLPLDIFDVIDDLDGLPLGGMLLSAVGGNGHRTASDLGLIEDVAQACDFPIIASGGVSTMSDLRALEHRGVFGAVLGSVLYDGELDARAVAQEFGG
jgi:phosphoribosylformimino-5-aminoimidazole carboxamide ribotide isomerase